MSGVSGGVGTDGTYECVCRDELVLGDEWVYACSVPVLRLLDSGGVGALLHLPPIRRDFPVGLNPDCIFAIPKGDIARYAGYQNPEPFRLA